MERGHTIISSVHIACSVAAAEAGGSPDEDGVVDCLSSLDLSFHELQLVRIEEQHIGPDLHRTLLLGDVHPDRTQRTTYRPTGYQQPLASAEVGWVIGWWVGGWAEEWRNEVRE